MTGCATGSGGSNAKVRREPFRGFNLPRAEHRAGARCLTKWTAFRKGGRRDA
jgi:hypothetical protein